MIFHSYTKFPEGICPIFSWGARRLRIEFPNRMIVMIIDYLVGGLLISKSFSNNLICVKCLLSNICSFTHTLFKFNGTYLTANVRIFPSSAFNRQTNGCKYVSISWTSPQEGYAVKHLIATRKENEPKSSKQHPNHPSGNYWELLPCLVHPCSYETNMKQPQTKNRGFSPYLGHHRGVPQVEFFTEKFKTMWCGSPRKSALLGLKWWRTWEDLASDFFFEIM